MNEYHRDTTRISKSGLDLIHKAPRLYEYKYLESHGDEDTSAFLLGRAVHDKILQPELFNRQYVVKPLFVGSGSQISSNKFEAENSDKSILSQKEFETVLGMTESVLAHPIASKILKRGIAEKIFKFTDTETGVNCKIRPDFISDLNLIADIKTTDDASDFGVKKSIRKFRYYVQDAFYTDGLERNGVQVDGFVFIFVEKKPPYLVSIHTISEEYREFGRETYRNDLKIYADCLESGKWPGYSELVNVIEMDF